jgi:hypothetical protein
MSGYPLSALLTVEMDNPRIADMSLRYAMAKPPRFFHAFYRMTRKLPKASTSAQLIQTP